ncbi:hypothetical protein [Pseudaestuariivita sp.]
MAVLINETTKALGQGLTGLKENFHSEQAITLGAAKIIKAVED